MEKKISLLLFFLFLYSVFFIYPVLAKKDFYCSFEKPSAAFLNDSLENFLNRMSDDALVQEGFRSFYSNFLERHARLSKRKQRKELKKIYAKAFQHLEKNNKEWFLILNPYKDFLKKTKFSCPEIHFFLIRYGQYQEYIEYLLDQNAGAWSSCKSYLKKIFSR